VIDAVRQVIEKALSHASNCATIIRTIHPLEAFDGTNLGIAKAEIAFPLWLLFKGVNAEQWDNRALESARIQPVPAG
jgi:hypothetical protein